MKLTARQPGFVILSSLCLFLGLWSFTAKAQPRCANETHCVSLVTSQPFTQLFGHIKTRNQLLLTSDKVDMSTYDKYRALFNKVYSGKNEINRRFELFKQRVKYIIDSNLDYLSGKQPFSLGINKFADLELGEFQDDNESTIFYGGKEPPLANGKDYRSTNCVTPVRSQGKCGSCYAFASMGVVESMLCLNPNLNPSRKPATFLSVQEVVDCFRNSSGLLTGCNGGPPPEVMKYFLKKGVALKDSCYSYIAEQFECMRDDIIKNMYNDCVVNLKDESKICESVSLANYTQMMSHLEKFGPISVTFYATDDIRYYSGGILVERDPTKRDIHHTHACLLVGYGNENGTDYWLVKNSWGSDWGIGGYFKVGRGSNFLGIEQWGDGLKYVRF